MIWWPSQQVWMNLNPEGCFRSICSSMVSGNGVSMCLIAEENTENLCWQIWSRDLLNTGTYWLLAWSWAKNNCHFPLFAYYCDNNMLVFMCMFVCSILYLWLCEQVIALDFSSTHCSQQHILWLRLDGRLIAKQNTSADTKYLFVENQYIL